MIITLENEDINLASLDKFVSYNKGGFANILRCPKKLEQETGSKFGIFGSLFGFRKFGKC